MKKNNCFRYGLTALSVVALFLLASCAHSTDVTQCIQGTHQYGFWGGLLHGFIAPFDLIGMIFLDHVTVFAQNNNGAWYAFGFLIGSGGWGLLGGNRMRSYRKNS
jgi:hypothetical protein